MLRSKKFLSVIMSVVLVVGLMPIPATAEQTASDEANAPAQIEGTPGVDYAEGEVLVAVRGGAEALAAETSTGAFGLLSGTSNQAGSSSFTIGDTLAAVSASDISNAAQDVGTTDEVDLEAGTDGMGLQSVDADADDIEIISLTCDDVAQTIADLQKLDCVVLAQPSYYYALVDDDEAGEQTAAAVASATSSDTAVSSTSDEGSMSLASVTDATTEPFFNEQWSLQNSATLTSNGYNDTTSLDVQDAWTEGAGNEEGGDVVVAVIDTGVDYTHEDLADSMWTGGDADWSTALGGGMYGLNAATDSTDSSDPMDTLVGHGTHCASTIAAAWNGTGIAGTNNKVDIMAIRYIPGGSAEAVRCFNYVITAKEHGVNVVATSNSWGPSDNTGSRDTLVDAMIYKAGEQGIISVFAAGNSKHNNDLVAGHHYNNSNPYLITVGALSSSTAAVFSHYGERSVDVFSPGVQVLAATSSYGAKTGTSINLNAEYLPWLKNSTSNSSTYFLDDASSLTREDGITYDLVTYDSNYTFTTVDGAVSILDGKGYDCAGTNNNKSLKFSLSSDSVKQALTAGNSVGIRVTIPAATWNKYMQQGHGDDLYFATIGTFSNKTYADPWLKTYVRTGPGWNKLGGALNGGWDYNWYVLSNKTSLSAVNSGKGDNGDVTILIQVNGLEEDKIAATDDYIYLDNISLGWATNNSTTKNDTYYYSDGTSMAAPNITGVVSLLCSHAATTGGDGYSQTADTAKEIVAFIKGSVTQLSSLSDKCGTGGVPNASAAYSTYKAYKDGATTATDSLHPVLDSITDNVNGTCTLKGSFFGSTQGSGSVTFNGETLTVRSWSDTEITFDSLSYSKEQVGKVVVTKNATDSSDNAITGQDYLILPAGSDSAAGFNSLPNPDFKLSVTTTSATGQTTTVEGNASEVTPWHMAAAGGYVYVYGTLADTLPVLMRYNTSADTWDTKNYLDDYLSQIKVGDSNDVSLAAGSSEIYLKYVQADGKGAGLLTLNAATGAGKYNVPLSTDANSAGSLGFLDGKLYLVGGLKGDPACTAIYPDTGTAYWSSTTTLPINAITGKVTSNGFGFEITGSFSETARNNNGYTAGVINEEINIYMPNESETICTVSEAGFFPQSGTASSADLDAGQAFSTIGAAAADGTVIVTGPVRNNEAADMVDTWLYNAQTGTWSAVMTAKFAPTAEYAVCSCTYEGTYYVMATDLQQEGVTQRFRSFSIADWGLTDEQVTPTSDALTFTSTALVGDVNDNEAITIMDAQVAFDMANKVWTEETPYDLLLEELDNGWNEAALTIVADANKDKVVNADDARAIQSYIHTNSWT